MVNYDNTSAYSGTPTNEYYLDLMVNRPIPKAVDDIIFTINETYKYRPDLLANDLYEDSRLWWVFAQRNPDVLVNPLYDFEVGTQIFLPKLSTLRAVLGF
jgi:hypothetical protein